VIQSLLFAAWISLPLAGSIPGDPPGQSVSEETTRFFEQNCTSCHTIGGGRLVGADLKGVLKRRDRAWLLHFLPNPKAVIDGGDTYAQQLFQDARGVYMPTLPGMTTDRAGKLLDLIEAESALEKSRFAGTPISDRPLTAEDLRVGEDLFLGRRRIASGAPPCASCHTTSGTLGLGGGRLGPDLTEVYARLEGRKALAAWLTSPPSATMQPVFRDRHLDGEEILALVAFLKNQAEQGAKPQGSAAVLFFACGMGLTALLLVLLDYAWRNRYRAVRRPMVKGS
jgi:mono/diheme cytochrome c family protein